ncbi:putative ABC transporter, ATP-binding protein, partial [Corchorus olitorius]
HPGRKDQQQHRAEVDREKRPELFRSLADRAEERPAGAIHRQRQAIDPGTQTRWQRRAATVAVEGNGEHDGHIGQGDHRDQPAGQRHGDSEPKPPRSISLACRLHFVSADESRGGRTSQGEAISD